MAIRAGAMRHSVSIESPHTGRDSMGCVSNEWATFASKVAASLEPLNGRELFSAQQHHAEVTFRVRMRYRAGIVAGMRILHRGRLFNVVYVINPGERNAELQLMCSEGRVQA